MACAVGCGRIDFDLSRDIDDNSNGLVDECCPCAPFSLPLGQSATAPPINSALLVSTGTGFIVYDLAAGYSHVDASGNLGAAFPLAPTTPGERIAWDGSALMHSWFPFANSLSVDRVAVDGTATNVYAIGSGNSVRTSIERRPDGNFDVALVSGATFQAINMQSFTPAGTDIGPLQQFGGGFTNASVEVAYVAAPATLSR